jgi:hypothetical protein
VMEYRFIGAPANSPTAVGKGSDFSRRGQN